MDADPLRLNKTAEAMKIYFEIFYRFHTAEAGRQTDALFVELGKAEAAIGDAYADDTAKINSRDRAKLVGPCDWLCMMLNRYASKDFRPHLHKYLTFCFINFRRKYDYDELNDLIDLNALLKKLKEEGEKEKWLRRDPDQGKSLTSRR